MQEKSDARAEKWGGYDGVRMLPRKFVAKLNEEGVRYVLWSSLHNSRRVLFSSLINVWFDILDRRTLETEYDPVYFSAGESIKIEPPESLGTLPEYLTDYRDTYEVGQPFVCEIDGANIVGPIGVPVVSRTGIPLEAFFGTKHRLETYIREQTLWELIEYSLRTPEAEAEIDLACKFHTVKYGFGSWLTSAMTQMEGLEAYQRETGERPVLILAEDPPGWVIDYVELMGYDWREWEGGNLRVERLVVPTVGTPEYNPDSYVSELKRHDDHLRGVLRSDTNEWFRENVVQKAAEEAPESLNPESLPERVYISRQHPEGKTYENMKIDRQAANMDELREFLEDRGFAIYHLEQMTVVEQILRMAAANVIVGPHGAGFANMIFADNDTRVIEIFGRFKSATYYLLSDSLGFEYGCLDCNPQPSEAGYIGTPQPEIDIDIDDLEELMERMGISDL